VQQPPTHITSPLLLQALTKRPLRALLRRLIESFQMRGIFIHHHRVLSIRTASISFELHRQASDETYVTLIASGLELHRNAHTALASLCIPDTLPLRLGSSSFIEIQLEIRSLDQTHSALFTPTLAISA